MRLLGRSDLAGTRAALLAKPFLAAVVEEARAQAGRCAARRADVFQIRKLDRHFLAEHAALRVLLAAADVLLDAVHALDERLARRAIDLDHAALLAAVVARNDFDCITGAN